MTLIFSSVEETIIYVQFNSPYDSSNTLGVYENKPKLEQYIVSGQNQDVIPPVSSLNVVTLHSS